MGPAGSNEETNDKAVKKHARNGDAENGPWLCTLTECWPAWLCTLN